MAFDNDRFRMHDTPKQDILPYGWQMSVEEIDAINSDLIRAPLRKPQMQLWITDAGGVTAMFHAWKNEPFGQFLTRLKEALEESVTTTDYEAVFEHHRALVRTLDVALNGEDGAAIQASLCDIVGQVKRDNLMVRPTGDQHDVEELAKLMFDATNVTNLKWSDPATQMTSAAYVNQTVSTADRYRSLARTILNSRFCGK